jgi:hypothetical protein
LDDVVKDAKQQARYKSLTLGGNDVEDVARAVQFLDRIEDNFFSKMRSAMEREEKSDEVRARDPDSRQTHKKRAAK